MTFPLPRRARIDAGRRGAALLSALVLVGWVDQTTKAWAWDTVDGVTVDAGGGFFVGRPWGAVWADETTGPLLDLVGVAVLAVVATLLLRRPRPGLVLGGGVLAIAGWASNLADRLGLHLLTAPGSERGVVDFLVWQHRVWNLADVAIALGTAVFVLGLLVAGFVRVRTATTQALRSRRPYPPAMPPLPVPAARPLPPPYVARR